MEGLKNFLKYNPSLIHIDLQTTSLPTQVLYNIGHYLTRATSLQAIHLCGNLGINDEFISWLRRRIRAKKVTEPCEIQPLPKKFTQREPESPKKVDIMSLFGMKPKNQDPPIDKEKEHWKDIRAGLKLQSIINSKRMNELSHPNVINRQTCIITRHIGYKVMIPGAGQWKIITDPKDECWFCG